MSYTKLGGSTGTFSNMMLNGFAVVTVMDAKVIKHSALNITSASTPTGIQTSCNAASASTGLLCELKTLKIANINIEGPDKEIKGGKYANTLLKYGKTATVEIQDALGNAAAIDALCGGVAEYSDASKSSVTALHFGEDFGEELTILGDTFFIDKETGEQVKTQIILYKVLPDSLFNLTQDAEGDATVFDMNGSLLTEEVTVAAQSGTIEHGLFYSILPKASAAA